MYLACYLEAWESALLLLSRGADPNKATRGSDGTVLTPLYAAAWSGTTAVCRSLLSSGARQDIGENLVDQTFCSLNTIGSQALTTQARVL